MRRLRLIVLLARPAVVILVGMFAAVGLAQAGRPNDGALLAKVLVAVVASLLFAVAVNDLADERIDRVNLPTDTRRPLVAGTGTRVEMIIVAGVSAVVALGASLLLHWPAPLDRRGRARVHGRVFVATRSHRRPRCHRTDAVAGGLRRGSVSARHLRGARHR